MGTFPPLWGIFGLFAGGWKLAIVALALFSLFGRGLRPYVMNRLASKLGIAPLMPQSVSPTPPPVRRPWISDRLFVFLLVLAATAVASLILGRTWIMQAMNTPVPVPQPLPAPSLRTGITLPPPASSRFQELAHDDSRVSAQL